jgi:hypothetical protein
VLPVFEDRDFSQFNHHYSSRKWQIAGVFTAQSATNFIVINSAPTIHTRYVMGLKKRSLSLVGRGQPTHHRYK